MYARTGARDSDVVSYFPSAGERGRLRHMYPAHSESPYEEWLEIEQGNVSPSTSAMLREYAWEVHSRKAKITKAPIVQGTKPGSRHPFPHDPVDPRYG